MIASIHVSDISRNLDSRRKEAPAAGLTWSLRTFELKGNTGGLSELDLSVWFLQGHLCKLFQS